MGWNGKLTKEKDPKYNPKLQYIPVCGCLRNEMDRYRDLGREKPLQYFLNTKNTDVIEANVVYISRLFECITLL